MQKYISILIITLFMIASIFAFGSKDTNNNGTPKIVTTIFPEYEWVNNILGQNPANAELTMLLGNGVDLHSYQPTVADIMKISTCDLFIYVGGESDRWVDDALKEAVNKDMVVINLLETLGDKVKEEEIVEGMQGEDEEHEHEHEHHHDEGEIEYDEHVWLSLKAAGVFCTEIEKAIAEKDPDNKDTYEANLKAYKDKIDALDTEYEEAVVSAKNDTLIFADRFPFRYMTEDYGLDYYAAFIGCSAETEASFETISFLASKVDELGIKNVIVIESSDKKIAETVIDTTESKDQKILV